MIMVFRPHSRHLGRQYAGFTLVEVAVTLAVLGIIASAAAAAYLGLFSASRTKLVSDASLISMSGAVIAFAKSHNRLPCPDYLGNGNEGLSNGVCPAFSASNQVGWFPYLSVGLASPAPRLRAIYGVYRTAAVDLANAQEHGGDAAGSATYADGADLLHALQIALSQGVSNTEIYLTGDGATSVESCGSNVVANPAFVVLTPGEDQDGDGSALDGIDSGFKAFPSADLCFPSPGRADDSNFDDRTLAVSFNTLMAKLNNVL